MQYFCNSHKAEGFKDYAVLRVEDQILALKDDRPRDLVPGGNAVAIILGAADTQDNGFWYEIRAWGYGVNPDSWQIRKGFVTSKEALKEAFFENVYQDAKQNRYIVRCAVIDTKGHRAAEIYEFCRLNPGRLIPLLGISRLNQTTPWRVKVRDHYPGTNKPIPGGLQTYTVDVNYYKDKLSSILQVDPQDPGAWRLNQAADMDWARQMCAEVRNEKGTWEKKREANHAWDVSVYQVFLHDMLGISGWAKPETRAYAKKPKLVVKSKYA